MRLLGAKYADFGCIYAETLGCKYADFGCMYAETLGCKVCGNSWVHVCGFWVHVCGNAWVHYAVVGCKSMERLGACLTVFACLTVGSFA